MDDAAREYIARAHTIGGELARELLAALDAAEARVAELEAFREAALEGLGLDPEQDHDARRAWSEGHGWQMRCSRLEQRVAELEAQIARQIGSATKY